ncbi:MAG TPA: NYN domain-containing protein [Zoogloea sp.]|uniref:NYN domain-containing protein n=1 Tax=Zoogloea sp. TaxID=49181 RepID=UPI002C36A96D|nr:NYN domain-containing protein [Zoogloea sp.]HMV18497.1 NYN domain-containing protein [Rhodocyclaceae bacterium]HMV63465.1 NYN domain-containing protein [Rhodocyclaceae bacterium]HMW52067.1 NYN domain-containing protein [Rhodocyclaceae bacterium]HMY49828.1 NYN domain-containing protein [Rhodocyclaceae bacterium]HMZ76428.1 NYN domain-containing protein [Rhodocyclaceae bacterium]
MVPHASQAETRVAVLADCDNTQPPIVEYALRVAAQFGRVVLRRGYGNHSTLARTWQEVLVRQAFTPCLQYTYAAGKNTSDIALALDALEILFDDRADKFCLVTSDSDFAGLCRKLRERGATVCIVGEAKTPEALRNASDQFFEWAPAADTEAGNGTGPEQPAGAATKGEAARGGMIKRRPRFVVDAVALLAGNSSEGQVHLSALGQYLKRTDPGFSPANFGHSGLLDMLRTYDLLALHRADGGHYTVSLVPEADRVVARPAGSDTP